MGLETGNGDLSIAGAFVDNGLAFYGVVSGQIALGGHEAASRHSQVDRDRLIVYVLQRELKVLGLSGLVGNNQPIGHYSFQLDDPENSRGQKFLVDFKVANAPEKRRNRMEVIMDQALAALRELLEMLRRQQHAFMPLDRFRYLPAVHDAYLPSSVKSSSSRKIVTLPLVGSGALCEPAEA